MAGLAGSRIAADTAGLDEVVVRRLEVLGGPLVGHRSGLPRQVEVFVRLQGMVDIGHSAEIVAKGHMRPSADEIGLAEDILGVLLRSVLEHIDLLDAHVRHADAAEHRLEDGHTVIDEGVVLTQHTQLDGLGAQVLTSGVRNVRHRDKGISISIGIHP